MRLLAKLLALLVGATIAAGITSALAALALRKRAPAVSDPADDEIEVVTIMDGAEFASTARAFRGGRVVCWYAGVDVDLRDATLDPAGARLDVRTVFGGTRVVVAPGVPVRVRVPAIFGGSMDATESPEPSAERPGLEIVGFTVFGGMQVITSEPGESIPGWTGDRGQADEASEATDDATATLAVEPDAAPA